MEKRRTSFIFFIFTMLFFYLPLILLVVYSFNDNRAMAWNGFTLKWYKELFLSSRDIWKSFGNSLIIALTSGIVATIIGTGAAVAINLYGVKSNKKLQLLTYLPLITPDIIMGVSLLILFATLKIQLGLLTIFIAHTTFSIPFVFFIVMSRFHDFDYSVIEAAHDLGASEKQTLIKVVLPMLLPAIISGFLIAVTLSFDDFVTTFFVAGPGSSTLPLRIFSMVRVGVSPVINAISVVLLAGAIILTISTKKIQQYFVK